MQDERSMKTGKADAPRDGDGETRGGRGRPAAAPRVTDAEAGAPSAGTTRVTAADEARHPGDPETPEPDLQPGPLYAADTNPAAPNRTAQAGTPKKTSNSRAWILAAIVAVVILAALAVLF